MAPTRRSPPFNIRDPSPPSRYHSAISPSLDPAVGSGSTAPRSRQLRDSPPAISSPQSYSHRSLDYSQPSPTAPNSTRASSEGTVPETGSRRQSTSSTMRTSSVPFEGPPTSTPTGRISKAKKGKRVHACAYDGCGKVFTRAEHRRRHELNHNPEAMFPCSRPGCRKAFHRLDLLTRHQERHDMENQLEAHPSHHRHLSHSQDVPHTMPSSAMASPAPSQAAPRTSSGGLSIGSLVHPQTDYHYNLGTPNFNAFSRAAMPYTSGFTSSDDSMFYTPEGSQSPVSDQYGRYPHRQSISSSSSVAAFDPHASPMLHNAHWMPSTAPPSMLSANMFDDSAFMPVGDLPKMLRAYTEADQTTIDTTLPIPLSDLDGYEWTVIRRDLSTATGILRSNDGNGISDTIRWYCLEYYWQFFHPSFPVVHRPTFLPTKPSPLLACAMLAIGSYFDQRPDAQLYSLTLLEIATRLLRHRDNITSRSRLVDLQTVFLLEVLSKYCSRRVEVEMSSRFRSLFASLDQTRRSLVSNPLAVFRTLRAGHTQDELVKAHKFWVEHETRRRILQCCFILDMHQMTYFEQPATIRQHGRTRLSTELSRAQITLPCTDQIWETSPIERWAEKAKNYEYVDYSKLNKPNSRDKRTQLDYFQIQSWLAVDSAAFSEVPFNQQCTGLSKSANGCTRDCMTFNKRAIALAKHTPIRTLLIVSGESWVLGKKLENEADFHIAKVTLRSWVNNGGDSYTALWNATALLRSQILFSMNGPGQDLSASFDSTHLLHEPWCVYLAALICWAHGLSPSILLNSGGNISGAASFINDAASGKSSSSTSSNHPALIDSHDAAIEAQQYLTATMLRRPQDLHNLDPTVLGRTNGLLEIVRSQKIGRMMCGLMNEAERVLYRLVEGRSTLSHF